MHRLKIIGCGRSGTKYTSTVFKKLKYDLGHESLGDFGIVTMYWLGNPKEVNVAGKGQKIQIESIEGIDFEHTWHQTREPIKCIESLAKSFTLKVRLWTHHALGVPLPGRSGYLQCPYEDKLAWATEYYIEGNLRAKKQASWTYKLEEFPWESMLRKLRLPQQELPVVSDTTNRGLRFAFKTKAQCEAIRRHPYTLTPKRLRELLGFSTRYDRLIGASRELGYALPDRSATES